ncbi:hypothetical protein BKA66DRAFT_600332 [Pyrenochaeta sp. MPI-SDFR-AT-0127]|nr:hypothetical protein BKA66DRAFT_600332 [Pyrenochaeta sp. MPI-SDFR-AT-0127]
MRAFGTEISGNRGPGGELSERQRDFILAQVEAGVRTKTIAETLGCSQRCVQKTISRWETTQSNASRPRSGRPPVITRRERRRQLRIAQKYLKIEYTKLLEEAGMWASHNTTPDVSRRTIQRYLLDSRYSKFRAKRRLKINRATALLRLKLAQDLHSFN